MAKNLLNSLDIGEASEVVIEDFEKAFEEGITKAGNQRTLASAIGFNEVTVSFVRNGKRRGSKHFWKKLIQYVYGEYPNELFEIGYTYVCNKFNYKRLVGELDRRGL